MNALRAAILALIGLGGTATAETSPVVVELFTSQGCSSCPPADEILHELAKRDDVIALALHVDYWDYIGWADSFASPAFTERQHGYARAAGERTVYTPQFIIGGTDHVIGAKPMRVMDMIRVHEEAPARVALTVRLDGAGVVIEARAEAAEPMIVQLVHYMPEQTVEILRGENHGRTLSYSNIVTTWDVIASWDGAAPLRMMAAIDSTEPAVIIVQEAGQGAILAAARVE